MNRLSQWLAPALLLVPAAALAQNQFVLRVEQGSNIVQVSSGSTVTINSPALGTSRSLQVLVTYIGNTSASFPDSVRTLGSSAFTARLISDGTPLGPNQTATIEVVFSPTSSEPALAQLDLSYVEAPTEPNAPAGRGLLTLGLSGGVPVYSLNYSIGSGGNTVALAPEGELVFPNTVLNSSLGASIALVNRGSSPGQVNSVSVSGNAFSLSALPALPVGVNPSAGLQFQVIYLPRRQGNDEGSLTIGFEGGISQRYQLRGSGILSQLSYEVTGADGSSSQILPNQVVQFPPTFIGHRSELRVRITNSSANDFTVSGISTTGAEYSISDAPPMPLSLAPGTSEVLTVSFDPTQLGQITGSLRIGNESFRLSGSALGLPEYTISGPAQVGPLEQPAVELRMNQPYPVTLNGTLNLGVASEYAADPSVQFSSGGRTVNFTIPANTTTAVFPNGANQMRLQTGSVASTFTITPTFATQSGLNLTPQSPTVLQFTMAASAPQILGVQVAERGLTSLTLRIAGFSTIRSLGKVDLSFTAVPGFNVPNTSFTLDLAGTSSLWFNSPASRVFGGQFTLDVQFLLATSDTEIDATPPAQALQSVSVTAGSSMGDSNTLTLNLR